MSNMFSLKRVLKNISCIEWQETELPAPVTLN